MPIYINEIRITATVGEQEIKKPQAQPPESIDIDAIIAITVEAVLEKLKELKED